MPIATADGIPTRYEATGDGPPLLLFSPGGFDANLENWATLGRYRDLDLVGALSQSFTCVLFDRREAGQSGGRLERLSWSGYARHALGLMDALGLESAHLMGGCVGCSTATAVAVEAPERVRSLVLFSPAGGPRYRMNQHRRFAQHLAWAGGHGLAGVVELARSGTDGFSKDPRLGPWVAPLRTDQRFAADYAGFDPDRYTTIVAGSARLLFDRDTVPGTEPEDLMGVTAPALIVPGEDNSHAASAARYLQECLPHNEYWDAPVRAQTREATAARILDFLHRHSNPAR